MESNREESFRCFDLALKAQKEGNISRSIKLANKSNKLYPTQRTKELIEELYKQEGQSSNPASTCASDVSSSPTWREGVTKGCHDTEILSEINRILSCKNLYDILNVSQDASHPEIKKQYRKLALKFHPDKCTAPRATEAFKAIGRSFGILSDPDKRRRYDVMGDDTSMSSHHNADPFFDEMDPFDLFANIFMNGDLGGGFLNNGRAYRSYRVHTRNDGTRVYTNFSNQRNQAQPLKLSHILPILPLLFILLWSVFNSFIYTDSSPYSFQSSGYYSIPRRFAGDNNYVYYVHKDFEKEFQTQESIKRVEHSILLDLIEYYGQRCQREMYVKQQRIMAARFYQNQEDIDKAQNLATPSCSNVNELQQKRVKVKSVQ